MDWSGHLLTDSGGYQVFSLDPKVSDDGATFRSTYDGTSVHLTPEDAVAIQSRLGADIQMVLDVCARSPRSERSSSTSTATPWVASRWGRRVT
jgi:queuine tRNA-ribosyltransferase